MKRSTSNQEVKKLNRNRVFRYVNSREETSMPEISAALSISGPTVLKIVNELKEEKSANLNPPADARPRQLQPLGMSSMQSGLILRRIM